MYRSRDRFLVDNTRSGVALNRGTVRPLASIILMTPKTVRHRCIGKAPDHVIPVFLITPAATELCLDAARVVPLVHLVQAFTEAAFWHDHFHAVREFAFDQAGFLAARVTAHKPECIISRECCDWR